MAQKFNAEPEPKGIDIYEPLPEQELFYRAPARFGSIPVEAEPKGWDRREGFRKHYPRINLPTQIVERVSLGSVETHEPNRLIWGDNLHVMRQIPSNSVDLIYIDPPFFSGRQYNVIWGDNNELRSFNDIWEGGMDGYLIWLNVRLYEMKRLLKPTGSIYVHCDWHASHYIKAEMDKIFGHDNFLDEIIWAYKTGGVPKDRFARKHDVLFLYVKVEAEHRFNQIQQKSYLDDSKWKEHHAGADELGFMRDEHGMFRMVGCRDVWDDINVPHPRSFERIGYPTQKPEALLERIIQASSNDNDIVADFFVGGGTTAAVAQRLGRRWIACDQSRVAVAVTAERLKQQATTRAMENAPILDFTVEQWGIYEAKRMSDMPGDQFRDFVLRSYGATRVGDDAHIHGWRNQFPIWVGDSPLNSQATAGDVSDFANAIRRTPQYQQANLRDGIMLAWGFGRDAINAADQLRQLAAMDVNFVRLTQVRIGDDDFREHIVGRSTERADYSEFLTFVRPPEVAVAYRAIGGQSVTFDAGDSVVVNPGAEIINVQWDFNFNRQRFSATPGYSLKRDRNKRPELKVTHKFARSGKFRVACRVQDSRGGEAMWNGEVAVR